MKKHELRLGSALLTAACLTGNLFTPAFAEEAQNSPAPFTSYSLFFDGKIVTHEILSEKKFETLWEEKRTK